MSIQKKNCEKWDHLAAAAPGERCKVMDDRLASLREDLASIAPSPFNPDSPKQLAGVLFNAPDDPISPGLGLLPIRSGKTGPSTAADVFYFISARRPDIL